MGVTGIALTEPLLFSCARVQQSQGDIRFLLAYLQSAQKSARSTTDQATQRTAEAKAAAVRILGHKVRHNEIIRGLHLSAADIGTNLQLAAVRQSAFQVAALQAFAAVNKTKATGDRKSTRLNSSHSCEYRMPTSA